MFLKNILFLFFILFCLEIKGQTILSSGDIVFVDYHGGNTERFSFISFVDLEIGTTISFTDNGWHPVTGLRTTEGTIIWETSSVVDAGTLIEISTGSSVTNGPGSIISMTGSLALANIGDQLFAYQTLPTVGNENNFITGISGNGSWTTAGAMSSNNSYLPSSLNSTNSIFISPEKDNLQYGGELVGKDIDEWRINIFTSSNWISSNSSLPAVLKSFVLPVSLFYFHGETDYNYTYIEWSTVSELNTDYFVLEKSSDTKVWEFVGEVEGMGNRSVVNNYTYLDVVDDNFLYYRLKQVDFNSVFYYSTIIVVKPPGKNEIISFPNPVTKTHLFLGLSTDIIESIYLYDIMGNVFPVKLSVTDTRKYVYFDESLIDGNYILKVCFLSNNCKSIPFIFER